MRKKEQNIFEEIGFSKEEAAVIELKAQLLDEILRIVQKRKLSQRDLDKILDIPQPRVSALLNGKLSKFSSDMLTKFLSKLGTKVQIKAVKLQGSKAA